MNGAGLGSPGQEDLGVGVASQAFAAWQFSLFCRGGRETEAGTGVDGSLANAVYFSHSSGQPSPGEQQSHPPRS